MQKRIGLFLILLAVFALLGPRQTLANTGYEKTAIMWQEIKGQLRHYQLELQDLYAEVESQVGPDKSKLNIAFADRLRERYPGSNFIGGAYGHLAVNNYTSIGFDSQWNINSLSQRFGGLVKTYDLRRNTLLLANGPNRVNLRIDLQNPARSQFTTVTIPALVIPAKDLWSRRSAQTNPWPLRDILNDVYAYRISGQSQARMDVIAEEMINNVQMRQKVLSLAKDLYRNGNVPGAARKKSPGRTASPFSGSQTAPSFNLFSFLPWYFWPGIIGIGILSAYTSTKSSRREFSNWKRKIISRDEGQDGELSYESRQTLHSPAEQAFLEVLDQAIDGKRFMINGKTRLADLIQVDKQQWGPQWQAQFNRISRKHVDFVILEKSSSAIRGVIELDDRSHQRSDRQKRDRFVDRALERAGIPILHYPCLREYALTDLQNALKVKLGIMEKEFEGEDDWRLA